MQTNPKRLRAPEHEKIELQMTPMIDIVFLLLVFFVMTFKIVTPEGDFNVKMPLNTPTETISDPDEIVDPIQVRLVADNQGNLRNILFGERSLGTSFQALRREVLAVVSETAGEEARENLEVELDSDYNLRYAYTIEAMTAISGYINEQGRVVKLIDKVKFAPPENL
jgi:biopolymer transport protein ExbD